MKKISLFALVAVLALPLSAQLPTRLERMSLHHHPAPVCTSPTPETAALLERLYFSVDSGKIISGLHHNKLRQPIYYRDLDRIDSAAHAVPLIWGGDLAWDADSVVELATRHYQQGYIITLMWHAARPFDKGPVNFKQQTQGKFTDKQWTELITEGSEMHTMWLAQVDSISRYLLTLQERGIPVIWRPLHEMNGEWFWWGNRPGPDGYQRLWRMLYDRMVRVNGLRNLIWVWNANAERKAPLDKPMLLDLYYPGHDVVDVLATDVYHSDWRQCHHDRLAELAGDKLIALGEVGPLPSPEVLDQMLRFAWFMLWTDFSLEPYNTLRSIKRVFTHKRVVNKD